MHRQALIGPVDDLTRLLAVLRWCADHHVDARDVIEGRHPEAFEDPTFPPSGSHHGPVAKGSR
jgi:hypothetical protein